MRRFLTLGSFFALALLPSLAFGAETTLTLSGEVPDNGLDHFFVPFDVPVGTLEIEVQHDDLSAENILDWGLNDPAGFRGWGGGNSEPALVGVNAASRSYLPGPIAAGEWKVVVGKAKIKELPAMYSISVILRDTPTLAPMTERKPYTPAAALKSGPAWYAGDFHVHSLESGDARPSLDEIATFARSRGLDFVELSDHNTNSQLDFYVDAQGRHPELLLVPGVEYTTYQGHANGIGATQWVDHKLGQPGVSIQGAVQEFHQQGALFSINHPALDLGDVCIGCGWKLDVPPEQIDAVEIETGGWIPAGRLFLITTLRFWEKLLDTGRHLPAIGGSDDHKAGQMLSGTDSPIGSPTTLVYAEELSVAAILDGIRQGRTVVKLQGPDDPMAELTSSVAAQGDTVTANQTTLKVRISAANGQTFHFVKNGEPLAEQDITSDPFEYELPVSAPAAGEDRYRVEVQVDGNPRTITSHLWLVAAGDPGDAGADAGLDGGPGPGPPVNVAEADGCGCRAAGRGRGLPWVWAAALLGVLALRQRRSRADFR